jgi:hypothetical protein
LEGNNRAIYVETSLLQKVLEHLANKVSSRDLFNQHIKDFKTLEASYLSIGSTFNSIQKNKKEILDAFQVFFAQMKGLADFAWAPIAVEKILVPQLLSMLKETYSDGEEMYHLLVSPIRLNEFQMMRIGICK